MEIEQPKNRNAYMREYNKKKCEKPKINCLVCNKIFKNYAWYLKRHLSNKTHNKKLNAQHEYTNDNCFNIKKNDNLLKSKPEYNSLIVDFINYLNLKNNED